MALFQALQVVLTGDATEARKVLKDTAADTKEFGSKISRTAAAGLKTVLATAAASAIAIGGVLSKGIADHFNLEQSNDKLKAQLGATAEEAEKYGKIAGDLYRDAYGESIEDLNGIIKSVVQNISPVVKLDDAALKEITTQMADFSAAFETDASELSRSVGQMLKTGMASSTSEAMDILTIGFQNGTNASDDLLDTFNEYGTQFRKLGIDGKTGLGLMSQAMKAGARDSDLAADALKEFSLRSIDIGSKDVQGAYSQLGLNWQEMTSKIAGGGAGARQGLDQVLDRLKRVKDPAVQASIAVSLFGTQSEDLGAALYAFDTSTAVSGLGDVAGAATRMGEDLNDNAGARIESFKRNLQMNLTEFVGNKVIPLAQELYAEWAPKFKELFEDKIQPLLAQFQAWWSENAPTINQVAASLGNALLAAATSVGNALEFVGQHWGKIQPILSALASFIGNNLIPILGAWGAAAGANAAIQAAEMVKMNATLAVSAAKAIASLGGIAIAGIAANAAIFLTVGVVAAVVAAIAAAVYLIVEHWDTIAAATQAAWDWVVNATKVAWDWIVNAVTTAARWVYEAWLKYTPVGLIVSHWEEIINFFREMPGKIWDAVSGFGSLLYNAGRDLINGLIEGIKSLIDVPWQWIKGMGEDIANGFTSMFQIHSPSRVMKGYGQNLIQGLYGGFGDEEDNLMKRWDKVGSGLQGKTFEANIRASANDYALSGSAVTAASSTSSNTWTGNLIVQGSGSPEETAALVEERMESFFSGKSTLVRQIRG